MRLTPVNMEFPTARRSRRRRRRPASPDPRRAARRRDALARDDEVEAQWRIIDPVLKVGSRRPSTDSVPGRIAGPAGSTTSPARPPLARDLTRGAGRASLQARAASASASASKPRACSRIRASAHCSIWRTRSALRPRRPTSSRSVCAASSSAVARAARPSARGRRGRPAAPARCSTSARRRGVARRRPRRAGRRAGPRYGRAALVAHGLAEAARRALRGREAVRPGPCVRPGRARPARRPTARVRAPRCGGGRRGRARAGAARGRRARRAASARRRACCIAWRTHHDA